MKNIIEAKRYISNAKEILREKANKESGYYQDDKYVKMAGHTAYTAVLVALDGLLENNKRGRKNVEWYQQELSKIDKKILSRFISAYDILHLSMGYDGNPNAKSAAAGLEDAENIIKWVALNQAS